MGQDHCEFKAILGFMVISRPACVSVRPSLKQAESKTKQENQALNTVD